MKELTWTAERIELLKRLWPDPTWNARTIAHELGITRNAVIGKAGRLGLATPRPPGFNRSQIAMPRRKNGDAQKTAGMLHRIVTREPMPEPPASIEDSAIPPEQRRTFLQLGPRQCKWPIDGGYCGGERHNGHPYCAGHCLRAFTARTNNHGRGAKRRD